MFRAATALAASILCCCAPALADRPDVRAGGVPAAEPAPHPGDPRTPAEPLPLAPAEPLPVTACAAAAGGGPRSWHPRPVDLRAELPVLLPRAIAWAEAAGAEAAAAGRPLDPAETAIARRVGVRRPRRVRLAVVAELPAPAEPALAAAVRESGLLGPGAAGLALGHAVVIRRGCESPRLLAHELRHVAQVERAGSLAAFLRAYLEQVVEHGYDDAPFEVDARAWEERGVPAGGEAR
jgi:hypothetical protein